MCIQGARTCYFSSVKRSDDAVQEAGHHDSTDNMPASSLFALENIIHQRVDLQSQNAGMPPLFYHVTP